VYLRFSLSYRDVEELLAERGLRGDHVTVWRWVQRYGPEMEQRLRRRLKPTNESWRVDETYIRVKGKWAYLHRAVDFTGATIDFLLSAKHDAVTAQRLLTEALGGENHPAPRVIHTDQHAAYRPAIAEPHCSCPFFWFREGPRYPLETNPADARVQALRDDGCDDSRY
jgi:IS6 family transposase